MSDPISIIGATASIVRIINVLAKTISTIHSLRGQWKDADVALLSLSSQLAALRAALMKIKEWMESAVDEMHHQLILDLGCSIDCCGILASKIYGELAGLKKGPDGTLPPAAKAKFLFKSKGMTDLQNMIDRQTSTLTLLLTACNSKSLSEQHKLLKQSSVRNGLNRVREDTASLIVHTDAASFLSRSTGNTSKLSMMFDFDNELLATKPYKGMIWKNMKLSIRSRNRPAIQATSTNHGPTASGTSSRPAFRTWNTTGDASHSLDHVLNRESNEKMLLLGTGNASKSTFLKQMQFIYGDGISEDERRRWRQPILHSLVSALQILLDNLENISEESRQTLASTIFSPLVVQFIQGDSLHFDFVNTFRKLMAEEAITNTVLEGSTHRFPDNLYYFLTHRNRVCAGNYLPTEEDILHARVRTTGITQTILQIGNNVYDVHDLGGTISERKKWVHVLNDASVVLFFVPMSGWDEVLVENENLNQMQEALGVFEHITNGGWFMNTTIDLCFTKMDMFVRNLTTGSNWKGIYLNQGETPFADYAGAPSDRAAIQAYVTRKFESASGNPLRIHYLDATNIKDVRSVLAGIFDSQVPPPEPQSPLKEHKIEDSASIMMGW